jgi:hypothetical protein
MLVEILHTVRISIRSHILVTEPGYPTRFSHHEQCRLVDSRLAAEIVFMTLGAGCAPGALRNRERF